MIQPNDFRFWNDPVVTQGFVDRPPDTRVIDRMSRLITDKSLPLVALDLGCGGGRHSELLADLGFDLLAVDVNPAMLSHTARRLVPFGVRAFVTQGSICSIPAGTDSFDTVISTGVLHQAKNLTEMDKALSEIARVSRSDAPFVGNMFTRDSWDSSYSIPDPSMSEFVLTKEGVGMTLVDRDDIEEMFEANGFIFEEPCVLDVKEETTGVRAILRFCARLQK